MHEILSYINNNWGHCGKQWAYIISFILLLKPSSYSHLHTHEWINISKDYNND